MTRRLAESLQKKSGPIPKRQETLPTFGPWLRMHCPLPRVRKVCDALSSRSKACKWLAGLPRNCRKSLGRFQKRQETLPTLGACLCMRCPLPRVRYVFDALRLRSNACKWLAGLPRVCRKSLGQFQNARKLFPFWAFACACAAPYLGFAKVKERWRRLSFPKTSCTY